MLVCASALAPNPGDRLALCPYCSPQQWGGNLPSVNPFDAGLFTKALEERLSRLRLLSLEKKVSCHRQSLLAFDRGERGLVSSLYR